MGLKGSKVDLHPLWLSIQVRKASVKGGRTPSNYFYFFQSLALSSLLLLVPKVSVSVRESILVSIPRHFRSHCLIGRFLLYSLLFFQLNINTYFQSKYRPLRTTAHRALTFPASTSIPTLPIFSPTKHPFFFRNPLDHHVHTIV